MRLRIAALVGALPVAALAGGDAVPGQDPLYPLLMPIENYYCTDAKGARHEIGQVACLAPTSCQNFLARCELATNKAIWRKVQDGCPMTSAEGLLERLKPGRHAGAVDAEISTPETQPANNG